VLDLIRAAFAGMAGRIDPPSSAGRLTAADLARANTEGEVWLIEEWGRVIACMVLTPQPGALYLGKLAVAADLRHQGIGRDLLDHAQQRARALGLPAVELRTRVELAENHAVFRAAGFTETGRAAHPGHDRPTTVIFRRQV
jgi:N-acetylglutamate synthase-like GNAT family acetyltransferase